ILGIGGLGPARLHVGEARGVTFGIDEAEAADAAPGPQQQAFTERRRRVAVADREAAAARLVLAWRHRFLADEQIVQARRAAQARLIGRAEHALAALQARLGAVQRQVAQELLRADANPAREDALEVEFAHPRFARRLGEVRLLAPVPRQVLQRPLD